MLLVSRFKFLLVIMDHLTGWVAFPTSKADTTGVFKAPLCDIICRYLKLQYLIGVLIFHQKYQAIAIEVEEYSDIYMFYVICCPQDRWKE